MTKFERATIRAARDHAQRALDFIRRPDVEVCRHTGHPTTVDYSRGPLTADQRRHFPRACPAQGLIAIDKEIGSDLTGLEMTIRELDRLLLPSSRKT